MEKTQETAYFFDESPGFISGQDQSLSVSVSVQDTIKTEAVKPKPTLEQIRYWRWLNEKKLLVGNSRYMEPKKAVKLVSSQEKVNYGLGLPVHHKNPFNTDWLTVIFVFALVLLATVRFSYAKYIASLFQSLVNYSTAFRMFRERNYSILHGAVRLEFFFYIVFGVFLFQLLNYFQAGVAGVNFLFFLKSFALVVVYFLTKKMLYTALGFVFEGTTETQEYLFNMDNYNRVLGIILLPVIALINYYPSGTPVLIVFLGLLSGSVFYVFLLFRGISILLKKQFSKFYLFLYLCTLEFLPLLLLYKVVVL